MALDLDGTDDDIDHGNIVGISGSTVLTVAGWFQPQAFGSTEPYWAYWNNNVGIILQQITNIGTCRIVFDNWAPLASTGSVFTVDVWAHVAVVYNGGGAADADKVKIYIDGVNQSLTFGGIIPTSIPAAADTFQIGDTGATAAGGRFINMSVGHVKVWLAELSAAEVVREVNSYLPQRRLNLVLDAPYDDGVLATDYSTLQNAATVTGAVQAQGPLTVSYGPRPLMTDSHMRGGRTESSRRYTKTPCPKRVWYNQ